MAWLDDKKTYQSRIENLQKYFYYFEDDENSAINKLSDDLFIISEDSDLTEILNGIIKYEVILNRIKSIYKYPYYLVQPSTVVKLGNALRETLQLSKPDTLGNMIAKLSSSGGHWEELYTGYITGSLTGMININTSDPIRDYAFYNFSNITGISAPNATGIGKSAFVGCASLKTFYAPEAKTFDESFDAPDILHIEELTLGCDLKKIHASNTWQPNNSITYEPWLSTSNQSRLNPGLTKNQHLKSLTLTGITNIGAQAFEECINLKTVNLTRPDLSVQVLIINSSSSSTATSSSAAKSMSLLPTGDIGSSAFKKCTSLDKISAPYFRIIHNHAFEGCRALTEIDFPKVVEIKTGAFSNCSSLSKVIMPICAKMANDAFNSVTTLKYLDIGLSSIPNLSSHKQLNTVIMSLATDIAENAFAVDDKEVPKPSTSTTEAVAGKEFFIQDMQVPALTKIQKKAFYNCISIPAIISPNVSEVWNNAFANCSRLQFVAINTTPLASSKSQTIKETAFNACSNLKYLICPELTNLEKEALKECTLLSTLYAPKCKTLGGNAWENSPFAGMEGLKYLYLGEDKTVKESFAGCKKVEYLTLPNCTEVGQDTFNGYAALKYISIPLCTKIGSSAFYEANSLKRIYLPKVSAIGAQAFYSCAQLKNVYLLNSSIASFGTSAFDIQYSGSTNAINFYVPQSLYSSYQTAMPDYSAHFVPVAHTEIPLYDKDTECTKIPIIKIFNRDTGNPDETPITFDLAGVGREKYQDGVDEIFTDNYITGFNLKTYFYKEEKEIKTKAALRDGRNIIYKPGTKPDDGEKILINDITSFTLMYIPVDVNTTYQIPYARIIVELDKDKNIITTSGNYKDVYYKIYENDIRCEFKPQRPECKYICISFKKCDFSNDPDTVKIYSMQNYGHKTFCHINSDNSTIDGHKFIYVHENETDSDNNTIYKGTYKEEISKKYLYENDYSLEEAIDHQSYSRIDFNSEIKANKHYYIDDDKGPNRDFSSALKISLDAGIQHNLDDGAIYYQREGTIPNYNKYKSIQFNIDENSIYDYFYKLGNEDEIQLNKGAASININDQNIKVCIRETHTSDEVNDNKSFTLLECSKLADVFDNIKLLFEEIQE